jgi:3-phosphoshikimate 1-carboxyvinyltransferase
MNVRIVPCPLSGEIEAISSKSDAHRLLILAALSDGTTHIRINQRSDDIDATIGCLCAMGAQIEVNPDEITVHGIRTFADDSLLDCRVSGSTFRFLLPVAAACCGSARFTGSGRLPDRPIRELTRVMQSHGVCFSAERLPFSISGRLHGGAYELPGNISSQYLTGLLLALPMAEERSTITLTTNLESAAYVDITLSALNRFSVRVSAEDGVYTISGRQRCVSPGSVRADGDWSNAAFFLAAGALGNTIRLNGLNMESPQGDKAILDILRKFGANVSVADDAVTVSPAILSGFEIDVGEIPDLLPILAVVAACAKGETHFFNAARLRLKESDRLHTTAKLINGLGGYATESSDGLVIRGGTLYGGTVDSFHDHRIAMAAAIAAIRCQGPVTILDAGSAAKSYPTFYEDYKKLGGNADVV